MPAVVTAAESAIRLEIEAVQKLAEAASKHPYYKFNGIWSRQVQDTVSTATILETQTEGKIPASLPPDRIYIPVRASDILTKLRSSRFCTVATWEALCPRVAMPSPAVC